MPLQKILLLDQNLAVIATAQVELRQSRYAGSANLSQTPDFLRQLFVEYERIINEQTFSLLDQVEGQVEDAAISVLFEDGQIWRTQDLQLFPETGTVSFGVGQKVSDQDMATLRSLLDVSAVATS